MSEPIRSTGCLPEEVISAFLDGDLPDEQKQVAEAHIQACAGCRQVLAEFRSLRLDLGDLAQEEPMADLWPAILKSRQRESQYGKRAGRMATWLHWWVIPATAAVSAAAVALFFMMFAGERRDGASEGGPVQALNAVLQAELVYADAIAALEGAIQLEKSELDPQVQETIATGLADMDRTIARCREAIRQNPNDLKAHQTMLALYQHKVDFMHDLIGESL